MIDNILRVSCISPKVNIANTKANLKEIKKYLEIDTDLLVYPELAITGYTAQDLFSHDKIVSDAREALLELKQYSVNKKPIISIGLPIEIDNTLYNGSAIIYKGKILAIYLKTYLPNNNEYYEKRWFSSARTNQKKYLDLDGELVRVGNDFVLDFGKFTLATEICEDLFSVIPPSNYYALNGANVIINNSSSNEIIGKKAFRRALVKNQSLKTIAAYIYTSSSILESTSDVLFSGHNIIACNGKIIKENELFNVGEKSLITADINLAIIKHDRLNNQTFADSKMNIKLLDRLKIPYKLEPKNNYLNAISLTPFLPTKDIRSRCLNIFDIQVNALYRRLLHIRSKTVVLGVSGGLDSTLALLVCVAAMKKLNQGPEKVMGITMPGFGTTTMTKTNAYRLMEKLKVTIIEVDITKATRQHFQDINHDESNKDVVYENAQARERTKILMDYANQTSGIVCGTGDLSELALGWCTYNADQISMYNVNASIPKTLVRQLVKHVGYEYFKDSKPIIDAIIDTPVSPELLPPNADGSISQITEEKVGPYILHDFFLYYTLRYGFRPKMIYELCLEAIKQQAYNFTSYEVKKWLKVFYKRFFSQQFKRNCFPDGIKVGTVSLSPRGDFRMASEVDLQNYLDEVEALK